MITNVPKEYADYCEAIAKQVNELLLSNPTALEEFRRQIKPFGDRWEKYERDRYNYRQKVKANPRLQDREAGPPRKSMEWIPFYMADPYGDLPDLVTYTVEGKEFRDDIDADRYTWDTMPARWANNYVSAIRARVIECEDRSRFGRSVEIEQDRWLYAKNIAFVEAQIERLTRKHRQTEWIVVLTDWWDDCGISREQAYGCWCPKSLIAAPHPYGQLLPPLPEPSLTTPKMVVLQLQRLGSDELNLQRFYAILAAIHDMYLPYATDQIID